MDFDRLVALNMIATAIRAVTYLEIGVQHGRVLRAVRVNIKVGVDPDPASPALHHMTSDAYFQTLNPAARFDLIFVDGLHLAEQVERDVENALKHLTPGGVILLHDCSPPTKQAGERQMCHGNWCGDVWRAWTGIRASIPERTFTVDADLGLGVICPTPHGLTLPDPPALGPDGTMVHPRAWVDSPGGWETFDRHRRALLGLVTPSEFGRWVRTLTPVAPEPY